MGGRGAYIQKGGFIKYEYKTTEIINGVKVIERVDGKNNGIPQMSNSPNAQYILKDNSGKYAYLAIYGSDRRLKYEIDITKGHTIRDKNGKKVKTLKRGIAHIHTINGGRENNVHYLTKKQKAKYGKTIEMMGGKLDE